MFFVIDKVAGDAGEPDIGISPIPDQWGWTLTRKDKDAPDEIGEAICRSAVFFDSERQARAHINTSKKAMGGVRFAQTRVRA